MFTINKRKAKYCNIKLLLIFLVIYGHVIEAFIDDSVTRRNIYKCIYLVHMPLFVFLTGYFINHLNQCRRMLVKYIKLYLEMQGMMVFIAFMNDRFGIIKPDSMHELSGLDFFIPYWHLWYLLSLSEWLIVGILWFKLVDMAGKKNIEISTKYKLCFILISILSGCLAGNLNMIGRFLSLSRTIVFLPYFIIGLLIRHDVDWRKYKVIAVICFVLTEMLCIIVINTVPYRFLWMADSYDKLGMEHGGILRLLCYLAGGLMGFLLLTLIPYKKNEISVMGTDTLPIYIVHPYFILVMKNVSRVTDIRFYHEIMASISIIRNIQCNTPLMIII